MTRHTSILPEILQLLGLTSDWRVVGETSVEVKVTNQTR